MNFKIITRSGKGRFLNFSAKEDIQKDGERVSEKNGERVSEKASERENESVVKEVATNDAEASAPLSDLLSEGNIDKRILRAMKEMGFEKLSPIQEQAIPYLLEGNDIIGQAQTGTGKTAAFGVPLIQKIDPNQRTLQAIVLCPTRELAIQAAEEIRKLAKFLHGIKVLPIYGGQDINRQIMGLKGVQIIVGTPGRVMDHMRRHTIKLDHVGMVVLDEADEMLNMGFREDMETILGQIPAPHQTALFSATMPQPILEIADRFQRDAKMVKVAAKELTIPLVSQKYYRVKSQDKDAACVRLLEYYQPKLCLIFCNTKKKVDEVADMLKKRGFQAEGLHGDLSQHQRDVAMGRFRNGSANILIATDVAARGIDVDDVEAVINYDVPQDIEYYVHRIGRTGRAGRTGRSFTFVSGREIFKIREIEKVCRTTVAEKKLPGADKAFKAKADKYLNHAWELHAPNRQTWGLTSIKSEYTDVVMTNIKYYKTGYEDQDPVAVDDMSYHQNDFALMGLPDGTTYTITYETKNPNTGEHVGYWKFENVEVHQGRDKDEATTALSSVNATSID